MKLLDAKPIKESKRQSEVERRELIRKLQEEEKASVRRLNEALVNEAKEKKRIAEDSSLSRIEGETSVKKSVLLQEIKTLEEQKRESLKPIHEIQQQAEQLLESAKESFVDSERRALIVKEIEQDLSERVESFADREAESVEKSQSLNKREEMTKSAEEELKRSISELSKKWADFHTGVYITNTELAKREREIEARRKANESYEKSLNMKASELNKKEIALKDGFGELEKSHKEIQELRKLKT